MKCANRPLQLACCVTAIAMPAMAIQGHIGIVNLSNGVYTLKLSGAWQSEHFKVGKTISYKLVDDATGKVVDPDKSDPKRWLLDKAPEPGKKGKTYTLVADYPGSEKAVGFRFALGGTARNYRVIQFLAYDARIYESTHNSDAKYEASLFNPTEEGKANKPYYETLRLKDVKQKVTLENEVDNVITFSTSKSEKPIVTLLGPNYKTVPAQ